MKTRTLKQNNSIHLFCQLLAQELNDAGLDMKEVLKPSVDISWTMDSVKQYLWKPIQEAMYLKKYTRDLDTKQVSQVYETINRHLGEKFGVYVPFPTSEPEMKAND